MQILQKMKRIPEAILNFSWARDFGKTDASSHTREEIDQAYQDENEGTELNDFPVNEDIEMESGDEQ